MVGSSNQSIWTFPQAANASMLRGSMSGGLHFMNIPTPMALLPSQQLGLGSGGGEGYTGIPSALNMYRSSPSNSEAMQSMTQQSHRDSERHDTMSTSDS
ncbi:hypothetical protein C4D60_Mb07t06390 [Musa balbisiana]|uniref:Uncharacterized protein n=3 Tax=Musa TaxID=4640 RepID=A0A4S8JFX5_MUSBA|nr:hypothetical protein C4D60_Mb07t06390 [Musa balbisiana]